MTPNVSIIIPAYNEEGAIARQVETLLSVVHASIPNAEIIVVDDGSRDRTGDIAASLAARPGVRVLRHFSNRGYGAALKTGMLAATGQLIAITDADGTYPSERLPELIDAMRRNDMVVGSRTGPNAKIPLVRKPAKWVLGQFANYVAGRKIPDLNSGMRVFRKDIAMQYLHMLPDQFSFTTTITLAMMCDKYSVEYITIAYAKRVGKSKIVPWDAFNFFVLITRMAMLFRPVKVFLPIASACLLYALGKGLYDIIEPTHPNLSISAITMFICFLITTLIGGLADAMSVRLSKGSAGVQGRPHAQEIPQHANREAATQGNA